MEKARSAYEALDQQQKEQIPQALVKVLEKAEEGWKREDYGQIREEKVRCKSEGEMDFRRRRRGEIPAAFFCPKVLQLSEIHAILIEIGRMCSLGQLVTSE